MVIDDHVIDSLRRYFDDAYRELKKEWESNEYERLADCPAFKAAAAYHEAMTVLATGSNFPEAVEKQLRRRIDEEIQTEEFWKEKG